MGVPNDKWVPSVELPVGLGVAVVSFRDCHWVDAHVVEGLPAIGASFLDGVPVRVVLEPVGDAPVLAKAEAGGSAALVAAHFAAVGSPQMGHGWGRAHPAAAAEQSDAAPFAAEALVEVDALAAAQ